VLAYDAFLVLDKVTPASVAHTNWVNINIMVAAALLVVFESVLQPPSSPAPSHAAVLAKQLEVEQQTVETAAGRIRTALQNVPLMSAYRILAILLEALAAGQQGVQVRQGCQVEPGVLHHKI
jgi:hypothetical protein